MIHDENIADSGKEDKIDDSLLQNEEAIASQLMEVLLFS